MKTSHKHSVHLGVVEAANPIVELNPCNKFCFATEAEVPSHLSAYYCGAWRQAWHGTSRGYKGQKRGRVNSL